MDNEQLLDIALGTQNAPVDDDPPAAEDAATATDAEDEVEEVSLDEALAALDGQDAPDEDETAAAEPVAAEATLSEVEELRRQIDEYKAKEAVVQAQQADAQFAEPWRQQQAINDRFFEAEIARIKKIGAELEKTQEEIDAAIYRRVELGEGFGIERFNPETREMETIGRIQCDAELQDNYRAAAIEHERSKTRPNAFEQLVSTYALDADDRVALGKFINYPPEHLEEIAKTLGAKNQRVATTHQNARQDAVNNVKANLSRQPAPGVPGQAPGKRKEYVFRHTNDVRHDETMLVAQRLGLVR